MRKKRRLSAKTKSEERIKDEQLRIPVLKALRLLKSSKILKNLSPKSPLPNDPFFKKSYLYFTVARLVVSLAKHQEERRNILKPLRKYQSKQEKRLVLLEKGLGGQDAINEKEKIAVRLLVCKEILKYSQYEHEDYWKDLAYWELFKVFKLLRGLRYENVLDVMAKTAVLFRQSTVSCKESPVGMKGFIYRTFPRYLKKALFEIGKEKVRLPSDHKLGKLCPHLIGEKSKVRCYVNVCVRERANIAKRVARLKAQEKALLSYDEDRHGELSWEELLQEGKTFSRLRKKGLVDVKAFSDPASYLKQKIGYKYLKYGVDGGIIIKILKHYKMDVRKNLSDLGSDNEFLQAISLHI